VAANREFRPIVDAVSKPRNTARNIQRPIRDEGRLTIVKRSRRPPKRTVFNGPDTEKDFMALVRHYPWLVDSWKAASGRPEVEFPDGKGDFLRVVEWESVTFPLSKLSISEVTPASRNGD
jgi:hypothetical protein